MPNKWTVKLITGKDLYFIIEGLSGDQLLSMALDDAHGQVEVK